MKSRWKEILYIILVLLMLVLYASRPTRKPQLSQAAQWWKALLQYPGLEETAPRFEGEVVLRPPVNFGWSELYPLANFEEEVEFLGCDTVVTKGADDEIHVWLISYWRYPVGPNTYQMQYTVTTEKGDELITTHELHATSSAEEPVSDHLLLPESAVEGAPVGVQIRNEAGRQLAVTSPILHVARDSVVIIWQR
jgi:hypothetical protein